MFHVASNIIYNINLVLHYILTVLFIICPWATCSRSVFLIGWGWSELTQAKDGLGGRQSPVLQGESGLDGCP